MRRYGRGEWTEVWRCDLEIKEKKQKQKQKTRPTRVFILLGPRTITHLMTAVVQVYHASCPPPALIPRGRCIQNPSRPVSPGQWTPIEANEKHPPVSEKVKDIQEPISSSQCFIKGRRPSNGMRWVENLLTFKYQKHESCRGFGAKWR